MSTQEENSVDDDKYNPTRTFETVIEAAGIHGVIGHIFASMAFLWFGVFEMFLFNILVSIPCLAVAYALNRKGFSNFAFLLIYIEVLAHQAIGIYLLGWEMGLQLFLISLSPMGFFNIHFQSWQKLASFMLVIAVYFVSYFTSENPAIVLDNPSHYKVSYVVTSLASSIMLAMIVGYFVRTAYNAEASLLSHQKHLSVLARTDPLTGLLNRRAFLEASQTAIAEASATRQSISMLMIDVDHFKSINDNFGHDTGDRVLINISARLKRLESKKNSVARLGGEEFIVLLPGKAVHEAAVTAESMRSSIESLATISDDGLSINQTVSIGVCQLKAGDSLQQFISACDKRLYEAKESGRNRVVAD